MATIHSPSIVTDSLALCLDPYNLKSYPGSGTTLFDLSGGARHGTLQNGVSVSGGMAVIGGGDDFIQTTNVGITHGADNFTYNLWMRWTSLTDGQGIFENGSYNAGMLCRWDTNALGIWTGVHLSHISFIPVINTWYMLTFARIGTLLNLYIDGTFYGSYAIGSNVVAPNTALLFLGGCQHRSDQGFIGNVGQCTVYTKGLSAEEIKRNYDNLKPRYSVT